MQLYNTLTRKPETIRPLAPPAVSIYTCGPTVYDYPHVGNWFTFIRYDLLVRVLKLNGFEPKWVMNVTDVGHLTSDADDGEDKLEKGARREGKTAWDVAKFYTDYFVRGLERLHITPPDVLPKATEHIAEQIALVQRLERAGCTYVIDDGVYYDTSTFEGYAAFARLDLDDLQAGARVAVNNQKRNPSDFALWKFSPQNAKRDMQWWAPWQRPNETPSETQHPIGWREGQPEAGAAVGGSWGFPGWHIECSAMGMKYLGETIDIHAGGIDHIPVHHTNEIAQSEAVTHKRFANVWMHTNHALVEGEKISKSLGNGVTLEDIEARGYSLEAFRLLVLQSHYRSQSVFSWELLDAAQNRLKDLQAWADMRHQPNTAAIPKELDALFRQAREAIASALQNDLGTPAALSSLGKLVDGMSNGLVPSVDGPHSKGFFGFLDETFGLSLSNRPDITDAQKQLIAQREQARGAKDWQKSDTLRAALQAQGLGVRDTPNGPIWFRN